ncbi:MAG: hypothetical protein M0Q88_04535 [Bacilli bacterium]|nr:hypothetical protein [Bacilli bacterium]
MKIGIFYATKYGTTKKCAEIIKEHFIDADLFEIDDKEIFLDNYDFIIVGSPVIAGRLHKNVRKFLRLNKENIKGKVSYFLCHGFNIDPYEILKANVDRELAKDIQLISGFGGELEIDKLKGIDKFVFKIIKKMKSFVEPKLDYDAINVFIESLDLIIKQKKV